MRVLFTTVPWPTHFYGMVPLAWALRTHGHEVRVATHPAHVATVEHAGLPVVRLGRDIDFMSMFQATTVPMLAADFRKLTAEIGDRVATEIIKIFTAIADSIIDDLVDLARTWRPDLIVYEPAAFAGPVAAAAIGVPAVRLLWGPDITHASSHLEHPVLAPMLARFGLDTVDTRGVLTLDPCPPSMQVASPDVNRQRMRYIPFNGRGTMPVDLLEPVRSPRICLTWGTSTVKLGGPSTFLLPHALSAAAELGVEMVVAITAEQQALLGDVPDGVRIVHQVPLNMLLPTCDAIVHQGGAGTILTAAYNGIPQLVIPQVPDQVINSLRLAETGAGLTYFRRGLEGDAIRPSLRDHIDRLLNEPGFAASAERLRQEIQEQPSPAEVVGTLVDLARQGALR
jgi:UDP:flavonoid glycosyltransferase YjiC (YdhE family)